MSIFMGCNFIVPSSLTLQSGGAATGSITDVQTLDDGNLYNVVEANGTQGYEIDFDFTNITKLYGAVIRYHYDGNVPHGIDVFVRNYTLAADTSFRTETPVGGNDPDFNYMTILIPDTGDYVDGSGNAQVVFKHHGNGSNQHNIDLEYVALIGLQSS